MQTRFQKRLQEELSVKERMAVETLIEISNIPPLESHILEDYSKDDIDNARLYLAREYSRKTLQTYDIPIPELVKYCKYNGSYDTQIKACLENKDMDTFHSLFNYRQDMIKYDDVNDYLSKNFNNLKKTISDQDIFNYLENKYVVNKNNMIKELKIRKEEIKDLKHLKELKDYIDAKERIISEMNNDIKSFKNEYEEKINAFKIKYT